MRMREQRRMGGRRILESPHLALPGRADAFPLLHEQHAVEKIGRDVDVIEGCMLRAGSMRWRRIASPGRHDKSWVLDMPIR